MVSGSPKKHHVSVKEQIFSCFLEAHEPAKTVKRQYLTDVIFFNVTAHIFAGFLYTFNNLVSDFCSCIE